MVITVEIIKELTFIKILVKLQVSMYYHVQWG